MHYNVEKRRGKAKQYKCKHCGNTARDWAHIHGQGKGAFDYMPLCRKCHMQYDDHKRKQRGKKLSPNRLKEMSESAKQAWTDGKYADRPSSRPDTRPTE